MFYCVPYMELFIYFAKYSTNMTDKPRFKIIYSECVDDFLSTLTDKARQKIVYNITKAKYAIDSDIFKKLEGTTDIWEFRTLYNSTQYRILAFWDANGKDDTLVVATHGFVKKTQKTPKKEIEKAEEIRKEYFQLKK